MNSTTQSQTSRPLARRVAIAAAAAVLTLLGITTLGHARAGAQDVGPLVILVSNDDGIGADGIDALVEALRTRPDTTLVVSAPATNQSGKGDSTTGGGGRRAHLARPRAGSPALRLRAPRPTRFSTPSTTPAQRARPTW